MRVTFGADMKPNEAERRRWNDERWTSSWPNRERLTTAVTPMLADHAALRPGERVLDVGCGSGLGTIGWARAVDPGGDVVGADFSARLVEQATARAEAAGVTNVSFAVVDMQADRVVGTPFDAVVSQFGVMFFDQRVAAFANIRRHLRPSGRLVFACWQPAERNPWHISAAIAHLLPAPGAPAPGKSLPGPFTLGVPEHTGAILKAAGFTDVSHGAHEIAAEAPAAAIFDESVLTMMGVDDANLGAATAAADAHLARFRVGPDRYTFPLALLVYEARNSQPS
jgi:SAM-dependent methyltransferase